jgi:hypothetical protein
VIVGLDQINQSFPWHHLLHFGQKTLASGALLSRGTVTPKLLACHSRAAFEGSSQWFKDHVLMPLVFISQHA